MSVTINSLVVGGGGTGGGGGGGGGGVAISAGTNSSSTGTVVFSNSNNVTFGMNGAGVVTASVNATAAVGQVIFSGGASSASLSSLVFSNSNNVSFGLNGSTMTGSASFSQSNQQVTLLAASNTTQSSSGTANASALRFAGAGNVSVGVTNGSVVISGAGGGGGGTLSAYAVSNTTQSTSGSINQANLSFAGAGVISVGITNGSVLVSSPDTTSFAPFSGGMVNTGNTLGNTGLVSGQIAFIGTNNVTLSGSTNGGSMSIYFSAAGGGGGASVNFSGGTTSNNLNSVVFSNSNNVSFGLNGSTFTASASVPAQSAQTLGLYASSQTTGQSSSSTVDARSLTFVGMNGVSVGLSAGSYIISGATGGGGGGGVGLSAGTQSVSTGTVVYSNSNNISFGMSGSSRVTASYNFNVSAGTTSNNLNSVVFSNANGVSFGMNGSTVTGSVVAGGAVTISGFAVSNTTQGTSGSIPTASLSFAGAGMVSVGISNGSVVISGPDTTSFAPFSVGFSTQGNTAGTTGFGTAGVSFVGGANITLSGSNDGAGNQTISVVGAAGGGGGVGISAGTQSVSTGTMVFSNSNGLSFGMSGSSRITASLALSNQVVSAFAASNTVSSSSGTVNVSAFSFQGMGGASVGVSNGSIIISAITAVGGSVNFSAGTTSNNLTALTFSNSNNVSFGLNGSVLTASANAISNINVSAGTTSNNLSAVTFSNSNGVSFGLNGSVVTGSVAAQTNQSIGLYASSQTTGQSSSSTVDARSITFVGAGGVSVGLSAGSYIISGGAGGGGSVNFSAGTTSGNLGSIVFSNSNNISFGLNGSTVTASASAQSNQSIGLYVLGNTTQNSSTTLDARTLSFNAIGGATMGYSNGSIQVSAPAVSSIVGTGLVSISTNGSTISVGVPGGTISRFEWPPLQAMNMSSSQQTNSAYTFQYVPIAANVISFSRVDLPILLSAASTTTSNTAAIGVSAMMVLYTRNGSTFSPLVGASNSQTFSWASNSSNYSGVTGGKFYSFALASSLTQGEYWAGVYLSTASAVSTGAATTALNATISMLLGSNYTGSAFADFNSNSNNTSGAPIQGLLSSVPTNTSQTIQLSQLTVNGGSNFRANVPLIFRNY